MLKYLADVVSLELDVEACNGCGMCVIVCPQGVFAIEERRAVIADNDACIECGACAINCPASAIRVQTGAGCATGVLLGAIGKDSECSGSCGVSSAVSESIETGCSSAQTETPKASSGTISCDQ